jgi:hypothetical protein
MGYDVSSSVPFSKYITSWIARQNGQNSQRKSPWAEIGLLGEDHKHTRYKTDEAKEEDGKHFTKNKKIKIDTFRDQDALVPFLLYLVKQGLHL